MYFLFFMCTHDRVRLVCRPRQRRKISVENTRRVAARRRRCQFQFPHQPTNQPTNQLAMPATAAVGVGVAAVSICPCWFICLAWPLARALACSSTSSAHPPRAQATAQIVHQPRGLVSGAVCGPYTALNRNAATTCSLITSFLADNPMQNRIRSNPIQSEHFLDQLLFYLFHRVVGWFFAVPSWRGVVWCGVVGAWQAPKTDARAQVQHSCTVATHSCMLTC